MPWALDMTDPQIFIVGGSAMIVAVVVIIVVVIWWFVKHMHDMQGDE